jgi:hypothetical protein
MLKKKLKGCRKYTKQYGRKVIEALTNNWNGKCFYSQILVDFEDDSLPWYFSFERKNNELAHTLENVEIICIFLQAAQGCQWNAKKFMETFYHMQHIHDDGDDDDEFELVDEQVGNIQDGNKKKVRAKTPAKKKPTAAKKAKKKKPTAAKKKKPTAAKKKEATRKRRTTSRRKKSSRQDNIYHYYEE